MFDARLLQRDGQQRDGQRAAHVLSCLLIYWQPFSSEPQK